jgi:HEAT repeat protein
MNKTLTQLLSELRIAPPSDADLYGFSNLDREQAARVAEVWHGVAVEARRAVISSLVRIAEGDFEVNFNQLFRIALEDADPAVRESAIEGLWEDRDIRLIGPLVRHLREDEAPNVRAAAATSLGRFVLLGELGKIRPRPHHQAYQALLEACHAPEETDEVRRRALESISYSGEDEVQPLIRNAHRHPNEKMRVSAIFAMGRSADQRWASEVMAELHSPNPELRYEAARACGKLALEAALITLIDLVDDVDAEVREAAIWALGQIGGEEARQVLERCARSDNEAIQTAASEALRELEFLHGDLGALLFPFDFEDEEDEDFP